MFGLIVSGRPVDAAPQALTQTQYAFKISPTPTFSHIVVFLLPGTELPPNMAVTVHIQIPPSPDFKLLGGMGPGKESAIYKVGGIKPGTSGDNVAGADMDAMIDETPTTDGPPGGDILVGLSIEPAAQVEAQLLQLNTGQQSTPQLSSALVRMGADPAASGNNVVGTKVLAQRIIGNAFNFLASFGSDVVPLKAFEEWWKKFEKRVELDPGFLEREEQG